MECVLEVLPPTHREVGCFATPFDLRLLVLMMRFPEALNTYIRKTDSSRVRFSV